MPEDQPFRSIKTNLQNILRPECSQETLFHIESAVRRTNDIVRHAYQLLKLFLIRHPTHPVDDKVVKFCLQSCYSTKTKHSGRRAKDEDEELKLRIKDFRIREYDRLLAEHQRLPDGSRLGQIIKLQEADMVQNLQMIPSLHYLNHLWRYVKYTFRLRDFEVSVDQMSELTNEGKKRMKASKKRELIAIKKDILNLKNEPLTSDPIYHPWIVETRTRLRPAKPLSKFSKRNIPYDVKAHPLDYIPCLLFMTCEMEASAARQGVEARLFHPLPLRASLIPCHITLDTEALNNLIPKKKKKGAITDITDELWSDRFLTEKKVFRKGSQTDPKYVFRNTISTDGVAATILLVKPYLKGKRMIKTVKAKREDVYLDDNALVGLKDRKVVTIDTGKSDLIYCNDGERRFRYTQNTRRKDLKTKRAKEIRRSLQTPEVKESATLLSSMNTKTCHPTGFARVVQLNNKHAFRHVEHYSHFMYRKLKLNGFINRQKSESRMLNGFEKAFGSRNDVWIAFGDHEQRGLQMRGIEPTIDTGLRSLFRKNGFQVRLIDEHRTSCGCHLCGSPTETYLSIPNPKPWKRNERKLCHGLLRCKSPERTTDEAGESCRGRSGWNRDRVATENMLLAARAQLKGEQRPQHLSRAEART